MSPKRLYNPPVKVKTKLTSHQLKILGIIVKGNPKPEVSCTTLIDLDQLLEVCARETMTKSSAQFTIRSLIANGMITKGVLEKRRGRMRVTYIPTDIGKAVGGDRPLKPSFLEPEGDSLEALFEDFLE